MVDQILSDEADLRCDIAHLESVVLELEQSADYLLARLEARRERNESGVDCKSTGTRLQDFFVYGRNPIYLARELAKASKNEALYQAMVDELILRKEAANEELMRLTSAPNRTDVVVKVDRHPPAEIIPAGPALCEIRL
mmetsp:Transcript_35363/g.67648  ORF Transcript_35363/g.67648 Transcript_35363/m.67648 type:complete len:139 (+) Transcript_35363:122-538(+)